MIKRLKGGCVMNRWRRKRRVSARTNPKVNQESFEKKIVKNDINKEEIRHLAKNDSDYRE